MDILHPAVYLSAAIPIGISYLSTYLQKLRWEKQLASPAADLNLSAAQELVDGYCGITCLTELLFSDITVLVALILSIGFGISILLRRAKAADADQNGSIRVFWHVVGSCFLLLALLVFLTLLFFPTKGIRPLTTDLYLLRHASTARFTGVILAQCAIVSVWVALHAMLISAAAPYFHKPMLAVGAPIILFFLMHLLIGGVGYMIPSGRAVFAALLPDSPLLALYTVFGSGGRLIFLLPQLLAFPCVCVVSCMLLQRFRKAKKSYFTSRLRG